MADIFISYAREDRSRIELLAKALEDQGWSVFWDRTIPAGKVFYEVIEEALDSAKCVITIWSKNSVNSNWVSAEAEEGLRRNILIPVLIEDVKIPFRFRLIQSAMLFNWRGESNHPGFEQIIKAVNSIIGYKEPLIKRSPEPEKGSPGSDIFKSYASKDRFTNSIDFQSIRRRFS